MDDEGSITFVCAGHNINALGDEHEAFYLRVYGVDEYCYRGAIWVAFWHGRMQPDERELWDRAKQWNSAINAHVKSIPLT